MKKEKSVLHLCECTLLALVILLIIDLYLLKFLQEPGVSYYPMLRLMEIALALLVGDSCPFPDSERAAFPPYRKSLP